MIFHNANRPHARRYLNCLSMAKSINAVQSAFHVLSIDFYDIVKLQSTTAQSKRR
jgi:hypothetical protein